MAQKRMPELARMVAKHYVAGFPSAEWERTRKLCDATDLYPLFVHVESLIATRRIDDLLARDRPFRELVADMYGERHPWLRDEDLGAARWEAYQEFSARVLMAEAKGPDPDPAQTRRVKREAMARKIREGHDVERWRKVLGFEGVEFSEAEIVAAGGGAHVDGGLAVGGGGGGGGRFTHGYNLNGGVSAQKPKHTLPPPIPRAPAAGGEAPRNPFTTEWRARDTPNGERWPLVFDPYHSSNQFIRRTNEYELPEVAMEDIPQDELSSSQVAVAAPARVVAGLQRTSSTTRTEQIHRNMPGNYQQPGIPLLATTAPGSTNVGTINLVGGVPPGPTQPVPESFTVRTRIPAAEPVHPTIVVTDTSTGKTKTPGQFEPLNLPRTTGTTAPAKGGRVFTPSREIIPPSTPPLQRPLFGEDQQMPDITEPKNDLIKPPATNTSTEPLDPSWLVDLLARDPTVPAEDLEMMAYRGWRIHSPKVQMLRIKNFLADEDIDRTLGWERKFAEISLFLRHCVRMDGATEKSWYPDLRECIAMLHTHSVFEQHHYGDKPLVVDFPQPPGAGTSTRLPPLPDGRSIVVDKPPAAEAEEVRPRYLLHRVPESVQDVDYQIPGPLLRETFLTWFRQDGNLVWGADPSPGAPRPGSGLRGKTFGYQPDFNMVLTEESWYDKCMTGGPEATARDIRGECNFYLQRNEYVAGNVEILTGADGKAHRVQKMYPEGEALQRFARYRGAKRAALQQCLTHFDSVENVAIQGPYRKLVLPLTRRQREAAAAEAGRDIVYKPQALAAPPEKEKLDPLGLTYWHQCMRESHYDRAEAARVGVEEEQGKRLEQMGRKKDGVLLPVNYSGPVTSLDFLEDEERMAVERWKMLRALRDELRRAHRRAPRQITEGVLKNIELGEAGAASWDVTGELREHRLRHGKYLEVDDMELYWIKWLCQPSTNEKAVRVALPRLGKEFEVFVRRVQRLLDEPHLDGLLAAQERNVELEELTTALNAGLRDGDFVLEQETVDRYCKILADCGRLGYELTNSGDVLIGRPQCNWHPEHRMNWPEGDDPNDPRTNIWNAANLPPPEDTWAWEDAFANVSYVDSSRQMTKRMLWSRAYRIGAELEDLGRRLRMLDEKLTGERGQRCESLQEAAETWRRHFEHAGGRLGRLVTYADVVAAGDPDRWKADMDEADAREIVRRGIIDELSEAKSTLWPARPRFSTFSDGGGEAMTLHRERVWDWARPEVAGVKKKFFDMNRWPVHLQTEETQERIRREWVDEKRSKIEDEEEAAAEMERVEEENRPSQQEAAQRAVERMLSVPYHEGNDRRRQLRPGTEFWGGSSALQERVMEEHVRREIERGLGPAVAKSPRTGFFGRRVRVPERRASAAPRAGFALPEVNSPDVPRSVPAGLWSALRADEPAPEAAPPVVLERRQPMFQPQYPPGQGPGQGEETRGEEEARGGETVRRVRFA